MILNFTSFYLKFKMNIQEINKIITSALSEDIGNGDVTANLLIPDTKTANLSFINREPMIMCGGNVVQMVFNEINKDIKTKINVTEGQFAIEKTSLIEVSGNAKAILTAERVALNLLQRMSSIATLTSKYVALVADTKSVILDTRKTMPCLREIDKYAVRIGGGQNHRMRLDDAILIKDNHIAVCGGLTNAFELAKKGNITNLMIEVECDNLEQVEQAIALGVKRIMLDNMTIEQMQKAVKMNKNKAKLEASGNVNITNVKEIAQTGVDYISIGKLTHSVANIDIGLDISISKT
jgi:nicotinate-nucleotide pyrophosphorylase (carboxylating)